MALPEDYKKKQIYCKSLKDAQQYDNAIQCYENLPETAIPCDVRVTKILDLTIILARQYQFNCKFKEAKEILETRIIDKGLTYEKEFFKNDGIKLLLSQGFRQYGILLYNIGEYKDAIDAYKYSIKITKKLMQTENLKENIIQSLYSISLCYYYLKDFDSSYKYIKSLIDEYKDHDISYLIDWYNLKGNVCFKRGTFPEAFESYELAKENYENLQQEIKKEKESKYYEVLNNFAFFSAIDDDTGYNNLRYAESLIKKIPDYIKKENRHFLDTDGYIYYKLKDYSKAIDSFKKAEDLSNKNNQNDISKWQILIHKGNTFLDQNKYEEAKDCYIQANNITYSLEAKYSLEAENNLAVIFSHDGNNDKALEKLKNALKLDSSSVIVHQNLIKLTSNPSYKSLWNYWNAGIMKKIFAISLVALIAGIIIFSLLIPVILEIYNQFQEYYNNDSIFDNLIIEDMKYDLNENSILFSLSTDQKQNTDIPINTLVIVGILVVILLSPIIKTAKIGTQSIELTIAEIKNEEIVLSPIKA